ncbi:hypothetical protein A1O1_03592 [Capronia coronata CBS 617.96]|uniref:Transcription factor domain-containing protein n=1 Tax=Capronia coronata CBS 617.96 TaxID=1182541 RepID=W9Z7K7_9EURO|nr:uncharacterized protein A1O1_03592 [Capronia coronata CBS 617.96]EXJ90489.1 hypothetical protein A1O1_03592 [Capronia coronata CBS 617.96]
MDRPTPQAPAYTQILTEANTNTEDESRIQEVSMIDQRPRSKFDSISIEARAPVAVPFIPEMLDPMPQANYMSGFEPDRTQLDPEGAVPWTFSLDDMPDFSAEMWDAFTFPQSPGADLMISQTSTPSSRGTDECTTQVLGTLEQPQESLGPPTLSHTFVSLSQAFQYPEDILYYQFLMDSGSSSLSKIIPVLEIVKIDHVSPYFYNAVLALSALSLSKSKEYRHARCKEHAMNHMARAMEGANQEFSIQNGERAGDGDRGFEIEVPTPETLVSWLGTMMLLANFELQRGVVRQWHSRLRTAGSFLSIYFRALEKRPAGKLLIRAYARMSLLLAIYNDDLSVTMTSLMNPGLVDHLSKVLSESPEPQDRLLPLVKEIGKLEINIRRQPELEEKWARKLSKLLAALDKWQHGLPATELPVDTGIQVPTSSARANSDKGIVISPLLFPKSADPCTSAINYATFLCTRMRAKTKFVLGKGRVFPDDAEQTSFTICRIAAGLSPAACARANIYGQGMLPALYGAYVWTMNDQLREWISTWWSGYRTRREGIWDVEKSRRCLAVSDVILAQRSISESNVIMFKILEELEEEQDDEAGDDDTDAEPVEKPFRVVIHSRTPEGWSTDFAIVE